MSKDASSAAGEKATPLPRATTASADECFECGQYTHNSCPRCDGGVCYSCCDMDGNCCTDACTRLWDGSMTKEGTS